MRTNTLEYNHIFYQLKYEDARKATAYGRWLFPCKNMSWVILNPARLCEFQSGKIIGTMLFSKKKGGDSYDQILRLYASRFSG